MCCRGVDLNTKQQPWYRALIAGLLVGWLSVFLVGCATARPANDGELRALLSELNEKIAASDQAGLRQALGELPDSQAGWLSANISKLHQVEFGASDDRIWVRWNAVPGVFGQHEIAAAADCRGSRCAVTALSAKPQHPAPLWLVREVEILTDGQSAVLCAKPAECDQQLANWVDSARAAVESQLPSELRPDWDGNLTVQIPAEAGAFAAVVGVSSSDFAAIAAVTMTLDRDRELAGQALTTIITNPKIFADLRPDQQQLVLTHEAVHVATADLAKPATDRLWVSEGIAEQIAVGINRSFAEQAAQILRSACPLPSQPPTDEELLQATDLAELQLSYARAWAAVGQVRQEQWLRMWQGTDQPPQLSWPQCR